MVIYYEWESGGSSGIRILGEKAQEDDDVEEDEGDQGEDDDEASNESYWSAQHGWYH